MWLERVYPHLPIPLQNLAVSLQGWAFHEVRYANAAFREASRRLEQNEHLAPDQLRTAQCSLLRAFLAHCWTHSPYYRKQWTAHGISPQDVNRLEDLPLLPMVPKQDLRGRTQEFFTRAITRKDVAVHTSGTTGSPLTVFFYREDIARRYAFLERCRRWAGVRIGQRRASFTGRSIIPEWQQAPPFWRYNRAGKQLLLSSYHLSPQNLSGYLQALEEFQPAIVDGYPSAIHVVADYILRSGLQRSVHPGAILVSAETVLPHQRQAIEQAFQAKLYNQYSSSEGGPFVSECRMGKLHVQPDAGVVEILGADGRPAAPGEVGEMVVTSFTTHLTPLVRYAIGDTAIAGDEKNPCPCGLPFPTVEGIVGRIDDVLCTPDRGFVGRLDTVFKSVPNSIVEAQIAQVSPNKIVLRLVPDRSKYLPRHAEMVVEEMRKRLGYRVSIQVEELSAIPRSANGKMRPVVNLCTELVPSSFRYGRAAG